MTSVAVNLLWLIPGVVGGSEEYTVRLLEAVAEESSNDLELTLFVQPRLLALHPQLAQSFETRTLPLDVATKPLRFGLESSWLAGATRNFDLIHHGGGVLPFCGRAASVVTVHDVQPLDLPENFSAGQQRWFRAMLPRVAKKADGVVTPSQFTADRLIDRLQADRGRITVVPPVHRSPASGLSENDDTASAAPEFDQYVLYPAITHPHKRHIDAVEALALLAVRAPSLHVVFTGADGAAADAVAARVADLGLNERVHQLGRVTPERLERLWAGASALVFPSIYEGFGNPVLEAMARSVPVVAADATALPGVAGGAAMLVEAKQPASLADGLWAVLSDDQLAADLVRRGRERATDFGPASAASALLSAYCGALR